MAGSKAMRGVDLIDGISRRRQGLAVFSARYSRFVSLMKVLLPAAAIILLVVVAVWPYASSKNAGFQVSYRGVSGGVGDNPRMLNPRYIGTTGRDETYIITARTAVQATNQSGTIVLDAPVGDITLADGEWLAVKADSGVYRREEQELDLVGSVNLFSDSGFEMRTSAATIDLARGTAEGDRPVEAQGPLGVIESQGFRLLEQGRKLLLNGRVKLVLYPGRNDG